MLSKNEAKWKSKEYPVYFKHNPEYKKKIQQPHHNCSYKGTQQNGKIFMI